jgi:DNA-binding MarR family transcriptional regulator
MTATAERAEAMTALGRAFKGAFAASRRLRGRESHRTGDLSHAQYQVLFELFQTSDRSAGELAAASDLSPASMSEMLDRLADAGLVTRARSETDRRVVTCRLTDAGRGRCEQRHAQIEPVWNEMFSRYSAEELRIATAVFETMRAFFERLGDDESTV